MMSICVHVYGSGVVGTNVARLLGSRDGIEVRGPFSRADRETALRSGADVVVIATTSFLADIADDVRSAVESGSNVITTAEEGAYPWASDPAVARSLDALARSRDVTVLGAGLNPGYAFDALVVTATGYAWAVERLKVVRTVDLSGFGETVLRRIGVGYTPGAFDAGRHDGSITGHIGFPQSMQVVAGKLGVAIERIDRAIEPIFATARIECRAIIVEPGSTAGFRQRYTAILPGGAPWFEALFTGHVDLRQIDQYPRDEINVEGPTPLHFVVDPGFDPQIGSAAIVANSIRRVMNARPGWVTVADIPPASPE